MKKIYESAENYLETILILQGEKGQVRSIDIAQKMNFSKPSVSRAMSLLRENGCIIVDKEGFIQLTDQGRGIADKIYERHTVLSGFLITLGVDPETAAEDACKMEHYLSEQAFDKIKGLAQKMQA